MKLSNRAKSALATAGYSADEKSAIAQLAAFAAQNSGMDPRNYFSSWTDTNGRRAYASEARSISADWRRFKAALIEAAADGVTDADVIATAPRAFSGRLEWKPELKSQSFPNASGGESLQTVMAGSWDYCTGQYFPTEYRKAAATLLEYAAREKRGNRPARVQLPRSIAELKALNRENGGCWFEPATMRFFRTRIETGILSGRYFITSEQHEDNTPRNFTVRSFDDKGDIETVGEFHEHMSLADAREALAEHLKQTAA